MQPTKNLIAVILGLTFLCSGLSATAATVVVLRGKAMQVKNGKLAIKTKTGTSRVLLSKFPKAEREALTKAAAKKRLVQVAVPITMIAKKKG